MPCVRCGVTICCFKELADLSPYALTMAADNEGRTQWRTFQVDELMEVLKPRSQKKSQVVYGPEAVKLLLFLRVPGCENCIMLMRALRCPVSSICRNA